MCFLFLNIPNLYKIWMSHFKYASLDFNSIQLTWWISYSQTIFRVYTYTIAAVLSLSLSWSLTCSHSVSEFTTGMLCFSCNMCTLYILFNVLLHKKYTHIIHSKCMIQKHLKRSIPAHIIHWRTFCTHLYWAGERERARERVKESWIIFGKRADINMETVKMGVWILLTTVNIWISV